MSAIKIIRKVSLATVLLAVLGGFALVGCSSSDESSSDSGGGSGGEDCSKYTNQADVKECEMRNMDI